jgi:HTH-like domain
VTTRLCASGCATGRLSNPRWGAPILHDVLKAEGLVINHKRTERIYRGEGLSLRRKHPRKLPVVARVPSYAHNQGPAQLKAKRWIDDFGNTLRANRARLH